MDEQDRIEHRLNDHADRIRVLETSDARQTVMIEQLCEKLDNLTSWIKALVITIITGGGGFFVWYVQSLPR
ncbi:MAG: hemolysin XhlA family protein [Syntrophomonas sp.]